MQSKKKMIVNTVFLVVIFALTIYGVFHGEDLGAMMEAMRRADVRWLLPGLFCVVFFIWGESIIIWYMMHSFQIPVKKRTCFLFSSVGFFFSCITPSASGGQPMQLYYMKKEKISLPVSTVILMIVTITYKGSLPEYGSVSWHPQNGAGQCPCDYICTEVCFICSNMVCIPRLPFIRHFLYCHCAAAGGHFRIG